ncbi:hypothetical protein [Henriciella sp.]|uniref:hypothetical protein n=1 Tax=Henriciella sp. TaxID=1968823 RepID=UPI0026301ECA|nr:hypothetical protein [Henriciella sp.]
MIVTVSIILGLLLLFYVWRNEQVIRRQRTGDSHPEDSIRQSPFAALHMLLLIVTPFVFVVLVSLGWSLGFDYEQARAEGPLIFLAVIAIWWGASLVLGLVWSILFRCNFTSGADTPRLNLAGVFGMVFLHMALGLWTGVGVVFPPVTDALSQPGAGVAGYALFFVMAHFLFAYGFYLSSLLPLVLGMVFGWRLRGTPGWLAKQARDGH